MDEFDGFIEIGDYLQQVLQEVSEDDGMSIMEDIAKSLVDDLKKLPRPKSKIQKPTHLIDSFAYAESKRGKGYVVGWGVYYGRFVEEGTRKMKSQRHLMPVWKQNQERYINHAIDKILNKEG